MCLPGSTGFTGAVGLCPTLAEANPAPVVAWDGQLPPDSTAAANPPANGDDDAYAYTPGDYCATFVYSSTDAGLVTFALDPATHLMFQQTPFDAGAATFDQAAHFCGQPFGVLGDPTADASVSVPTPASLLELLDLRGTNGLLPSGMSGPAGTYWSSAGSGAPAFHIDFTTGDFRPQGLVTVGNAPHVRCQAGPATQPTMSDPCATGPGGLNTCQIRSPDGGTGLQFAVDDPSVLADGGGLDRAAALAYCNTLTTCGQYRLPSYKELATLVNFTKNAFSGGPNDWNNALAGPYWSASDSPSAADSAMAIYFAQPGTPHVDGGSGAASVGFSAATGAPTDGGAALRFNVLCVTGP